MLKLIDNCLMPLHFEVYQLSQRNGVILMNSRGCSGAEPEWSLRSAGRILIHLIEL